MCVAQRERGRERGMHAWSSHIHACMWACVHTYTSLSPHMQALSFTLSSHGIKGLVILTSPLSLSRSLSLISRYKGLAIYILASPLSLSLILRYGTYKGLAISRPLSH